MAMNPTTWGAAVAAAVKALNIQAGTPITDAQLVTVWQTITSEHDSHISANAAVTVPGVQTGGSTITNGTVT